MAANGDTAGNNKATSKVTDCFPDVQLGPLAGRVGLRNLGNSCFMNAGLQCICHIEPLAEYFLSDGFESDLSESSTTASSDSGDSQGSQKGKLARSFAGLLREFWHSGVKSQSLKGSGSSSRLSKAS